MKDILEQAVEMISDDGFIIEAHKAFEGLGPVPEWASHVAVYKSDAKKVLYARTYEDDDGKSLFVGDPAIPGTRSGVFDESLWYVIPLGEPPETPQERIDRIWAEYQRELEEPKLIAYPGLHDDGSE